MKRITLYLVCSLLMSYTLFAQKQQTLLMMDDFEDDQPGPIFSLNGALLGQPNTGTNRWVVNDKYIGTGGYADTPPQDSTLGGLGQIGYPNQHYMYISRDMADTTLNASYDPLVASDRFARIGASTCTFGYTAIKFSFWWLCQGSPGDYGEVYYSLNGGATWILATNTEGFTQYSNMNVWKYQIIKLPDFINADGLTFAFKWHNDGIDTGDEIPFSIDDVMVVAEWDESIANPVQITSIGFSPLTICQETAGASFLFNISDSLCPGTYEVVFSDSNGAFANTTTYTGITTGQTYDIGSYSVGLPPFPPTTMPIGGCYTFQVNRITPPYITGEVFTGCITIVDCPDSIAIAQPPAVTQFGGGAGGANGVGGSGTMPGLPAGQQPVCVYSVIDVLFFTYGAYNPGNNYSLELSDENGDFANGQVIGGPMQDFFTYDPALYPNDAPGSISGQIPIVPAGCNYMLRVVSDNPVVIGREWGPFCIQECDIKTNDAVDVTVCLTDLDSVCVTLDIDINSFDPAFFYNAGNVFMAEVLSPGDPPAYPPPMTVIGATGELSFSIDTVSGTMELCFPPISDYIALGYTPGMYYMRIISTDGVDTNNLWGSVIRMTVNGISGTGINYNLMGSTGLPIDTVCKNLDVVCINMNNHNPPMDGSLYDVVFNFEGSLFGGFTWNPQIHPYPTVCLNLSSFTKYGWYTVTVQEYFGGDPSCAGPITAPDSFYLEGPPVIDFPIGDICVGDTTILSANHLLSTYFEWTLNDPKGIANVLYYSNTELAIEWVDWGTMSLNIIAISKCGEANSVKTLSVIPQSDVTLFQDTTICEGDEFYLKATNTFQADNDFDWYVNGILFNSVHVANSGEDSMLISPTVLTAYMVEIDNGCPDSDTVLVKVVKKPTVVSLADESICIGDSTQLDASVIDGASYIWSPSTGLSDPNIIDPIAKPVVPTTYVVAVIYDSICKVLTDTFFLDVTTASISAGGDTTIFKGDEVIIYAEGGTEYVWTPEEGLSSAYVSNPTASPDSTTTYYVMMTDINGCSDSDSVTIEVVSFLFEPEVPDAFTPNGSGNAANEFLYVFDVLGDEGDAIESIVFKIFNRWGELIFIAEETNEIIYPHGGWDGTNMNNGKEMEVGVYVWLLEAQTVKGVKIGPISGNVSLLK